MVAKTTLKQKKAIAKVIENRGNVSRAMIEVGYSPKTAKNPRNLTNSKAWAELMKEHLADLDLAKKHEALLNSHKIEHMVFPLGPAGEDDPHFSGARPDTDGEDEDEEVEDVAERTALTDKEIIELLAEVNCKVSRIVHGETCRHVYYWAPDNKARKDALDMAYKLKGRYPKEVAPKGASATFNTVVFNGDQATRIARRVLSGNSAGPATSDRLPDSDQPAV